MQSDRIFTGRILDSQGCRIHCLLHADNEYSDQTARKRRLIFKSILWGILSDGTFSHVESHILFFRKSSRYIVLILISLTLITKLMTDASLTERIQAKTAFEFILEYKHKSNTHELKGTFENRSLSKPEKRHIAFLKVHKAASSTVQNILYRFGSDRNLSFVLPRATHYISQHNAKKYSAILPSFDNSTKKYDILCNHVTFNRTKFKQLLYDDAFYLAIVREPLDLFISSAYYYKYVWPSQYLRKLNATTFIHDLITNPEKHETKNLETSRTFNYMTFDFGYIVNRTQDITAMNDTSVASFISQLTDSFDFVMIVEHFDESLVMLKRYLNWSTKDILYIKRNEFRQNKNRVKTTMADVTEQDKILFKKRNRLDYAIYEKFLDLFMRRRSKEKDLDDEVNEFKTLLEKVSLFCSGSHSNASNFTVFPRTKWNTGFSLDARDCRLMMMNEIPFWKALKEKHEFLLKR